MDRLGAAKEARWPEVPARRGRGRVGAALARWNPSSTEEQRRAFYQRRLTLFCGVALSVFVVVMTFANVAYQTLPETRPELLVPLNLLTLGGLSTLAFVLFFVLLRRQLSLGTLFVLDIAAVTIVGIALGVGMALSTDRIANVFSTFIFNTFSVFTRMAIVPSSGQRTLVASSAAFTPHLLAAPVVAVHLPDHVNMPEIFTVLGAAVYCGAAVILASIGSQVIYGLRRQVVEAQQLGQYTLLEKIGEGGMGTVHRAEHAMLRRPTAIKLLPVDKAGELSITRFEREVQLTAQLTHPNTIAIFDYGRSPDGVFYYAMELLDGLDLDRLVRLHGPQPAGRVIHILRQVCGALEEAHRRGLIHRDIKPANVMLTMRGGLADVVKVLDFGLAKDLTSRPGELSTDLAGTPAFMAPEVVKDPGRVGPSSDLYAVGALGYFLVTGETVFRARSALELIVHHARTEPIPPSERSGLPIPADLEKLILECLRKEPGDRPASANALRQALGELDAARTWGERDAASWWDEHHPGGARASAISPGSVKPVAITIDLTDRTRPGF